LKQPEQSETLQIVIESLGWARKKQPLSVSIPPEIKHELVKLYNVRPNLSTAQSRVKCQIDSITEVQQQHIRRVCHNRSQNSLLFHPTSTNEKDTKIGRKYTASDTSKL
jgi:hypothetical protein